MTSAQLSHWTQAAANVAGIRPFRAWRAAVVLLGLGALIALMPRAQETGSAEVLQALAEQQVIVTQNLDGGYELDYSDAPGGTFEQMRERLDALSPIVRLRLANDDVVKHLDLDGLTQLQDLELANNAALRSINGLADLKRLQTLVISNNDRLKDEIAPFEGLAELQTLEVIDNHRLRRLPDLGGLARLRDLEIVGNERLEAITGLEGLRELEQLEVRGNDRLAELAMHGALVKLQSLAIYRNPELEMVSGLDGSRELERLVVYDNDDLTALPELDQLVRLRSLEISDNSELGAITGLENLAQLERLVITDNGVLTSLSGLDGLASLRSLVIYGNDSLTSVFGLGGLDQLLLLVIWDNPVLTDVAGLGALPNLQRAAVAGSLVDQVIDAFQHTPELQTLVLDDGADTRRVGVAINEMRRNAGLAPVEISHSPPGSLAWWDAMRG